MPVATAFSVTSCATVEEVTPQTVNEALATAEIALIGAAVITTQAVEANVITLNQGKDFMSYLEEAAEHLDQAHQLVNTGEAILALANR